MQKNNKKSQKFAHIRKKQYFCGLFINTMSIIRKIGGIFCCILFSAGLMAAPAYSGWQLKPMADGTTAMLRMVGDEFYFYWESEYGQLAFEQADGTFVLTDEQSPDEAEIQLRRKMAGAPVHRTTGYPLEAPRGLIILVQFADTKFQAANSLAAFVDMFNKEGYDHNGAYGSAADYFKAQSNNTYKPEFDVFGPVTLTNNVNYYGEMAGGYNDRYLADFVIEAVTAAEAEGCDFSKYDANKDGYVDIVYLLYAGKGQADGGGTETIWPLNWTISSMLLSGLTHGETGYTYTKLPKFDGYTINNFACSGELNGFTGDRAGIGTFCHEFSHVLGLPDYYVTNANAVNSNKNYTPGAWSLMDQGLYNNEGNTPPNYSAFDKYFMGWITPKALLKDQQADVTLTTKYGDAYQISGASNGPKVYSYNQMVWYLENRQKTGWDGYLPGHGMCVWEVKYSTSNWRNNVPNNSTVGYTIVTANDLTRPYKPYVYYPKIDSESGTTFPGKNNVTSFTPAEGCALTAIAESGDRVTFKFNGGASEFVYAWLATDCTVEEGDGTVATGQPLEVQIIPNTGYTLADAACWTVEMGVDELVYGVDFTYESETNLFKIASVTGDVTILAEAKIDVPSSVREGDGIESSNESHRKILRLEDGVLYIISGGKKYSVLGQER